MTDTQIFNFNHSVDVAMTRNVSKDRGLRTDNKQGGAGTFSQCLTVYWPILQAVQMWMTVASGREVCPDDAGSQEEALV